MLRIFMILLIPVLIWMLIGSCRELESNYGKESFNDFMGGVVWIISLTIAIASTIVYVTEGKTLIDFIHFG